MRVQVNPGALTKYDIGWEQIQATLTAANANRPKGSLSDDQTCGRSATTDQLFTAAEYTPLIVAYRMARAVRLSDIATVTDSLENRRNIGLANGKPSVLIQITKQPSANIIETVDHIYELLPQLKASIPPSVESSMSSSIAPRRFARRSPISSTRF